MVMRCVVFDFKEMEEATRDQKVPWRNAKSGPLAPDPVLGLRVRGRGASPFPSGHEG